MIEPDLNCLLKIITSVGFGSESPVSGLLTGKRPSGEDQVSGPLFSDQSRQRGTGNRRVAAESNFRKTPFCVGRGEAHVANHGEFRAPTQTRTLNFGNGDLGQLDDLHDQPVKLLKHGLDQFRCMDGYIDSSGESLFVAFQNDSRYLRLLLGMREGLAKLVHHLEIDYVERRVRERDACQRIFMAYNDAGRG